VDSYPLACSFIPLGRYKYEFSLRTPKNPKVMRLISHDGWKDRSPLMIIGSNVVKNKA